MYVHPCIVVSLSTTNVYSNRKRGKIRCKKKRKRGREIEEEAKKKEGKKREKRKRGKEGGKSKRERVEGKTRGEKEREKNGYLNQTPGSHKCGPGAVRETQSSQLKKLRQVKQELQKTLELKTQTRSTGGNAAPPDGKESIHPKRHAGPSMAQGRVTLKLSMPPSQFGAPRRRRVATPAPADGFPGQPRRSLRLAICYNPHILPQTKTSLWWKILCLFWTLYGGRSCALFGRSWLPGADARHSSAPCPRCRKPLATHLSGGASSSYWGSASSWSKLFNGGSGAGKPGGSGMNSATFACRGVHAVA